MILSLPVLVIVLAVVGFIAARTRARVAVGGDVRTLAALPGAHGANAALSVLIPAIACFAVLALLRVIAARQGLDILSDRAVFWLVLAIAAIGGIAATLRSSKRFRARVASEAWVKSLLIVASSVLPAALRSARSTVHMAKWRSGCSNPFMRVGAAL